MANDVLTRRTGGAWLPHNKTRIHQYARFDKFKRWVVIAEAPHYDEMQPGVLYVVDFGESGFEGVKFLCPCGCGNSVWLPQEHRGGTRHAGWNIIVNGRNGVTLGDASGRCVPGYSVGNENVCGAHFFVENMQVRDAG